MDDIKRLRELAGLDSSEISEDLSNGYGSEEYACGDDYFPDGADGPVVDAVGPSGAKQGDNPEQKKMDVAETHKELVYAYRRFLEESNNPDSKKKLIESESSLQNVDIVDTDLSFSWDNDSITADGIIYISAEPLIQGQKVNIDYSLSIDVTANIEWVKQDEPVSWNYSTDSPNYRYYVEGSTYGDLNFKKLEFDRLSAFVVDNREMPYSEFRKIVGDEILKSILNSSLYSKELDKILNSRVRELDPPSENDQDF